MIFLNPIFRDRRLAGAGPKTLRVARLAATSAALGLASGALAQAPAPTAAPASSPSPRDCASWIYVQTVAAPAPVAPGASPTGAGAASPASPAANAGPWVCKVWRAAAQ